VYACRTHKLVLEQERLGHGISDAHAVSNVTNEAVWDAEGNAQLRCLGRQRVF
jgi:hypothetical protein